MPTTNTAAVTEEKPPVVKDDEIGFPLSRILEESDAFLTGVHPADVAGAFAGIDPGTEVTKKAARERVASWLKSEVHQADQE